MDHGSGSPWASVARTRLLPIRASREPAGTEWTPAGSPAEEPVSPTARAMEDIGIYMGPPGTHLAELYYGLNHLM